MSTPRTATSAPRAPVRSARPARRTHYPDGSPQAVFGQPAFRLQSEPAIPSGRFQVVPIQREPGDEATHLAECRHGDGRTFHQAREPERLDCDCPEFSHSGTCPHLARLLDLGVFPSIESADRWTLATKGGGA